MHSSSLYTTILLLYNDRNALTRHETPWNLTNAVLDGVLEPVDRVAIVLVSLSLLLGPRVGPGRVPGLLLGVLPGEVSAHGPRAKEGEGGVGEADGVALDVVVLGVRLGVDEGRDATTGVTERDDDGGSNTLLERTTAVVGTPRHDDGNERVHAGSGKEETDVVDGGNVGGEKHHVADTSDTGTDHGDDTSPLESIRHVTSTNGRDGSENVRWNREELGVGSSVTEFGGQSWRKQGKAVNWHQSTLEKHGRDPDLPVEKSIPDELPFEGGAATVVVEQKSLLKHLSLVFGQKFGRVGVVVEHPERGDGGEDCHDALQDENPTPTFVVTDAVHEVDETSEQTTESTGSSGGGKEEGDSEIDLVSSVPLSEEEGDTGE